MGRRMEVGVRGEGCRDCWRIEAMVCSKLMLLLMRMMMVKRRRGEDDPGLVDRPV
jgi:hypothetical protein